MTWVTPLFHHLCLIILSLFFFDLWSVSCTKLPLFSPGIDEEDIVAPEESGDAGNDEMPPLEGEEDDASRMEEVD